MTISPTLEDLSVDIAGLVPYDRNPRRSDLTAITESLQAHGQYRPVVANKRGNVVVAGSGVLAAAKQLGWDSLAVTWIDVDDETAARISLVDNRTSDVAGYDDQALADLLQALPDLSGTGYDDTFLDELLIGLQDRPALTDPDDAPPAPREPLSELGQVWLLGGGQHRVMCGDATSSNDVQSLLGSAESVDAVWTDPPYGVSYVGGTKDKLTIINDDLRESDLGALLLGAFTNVATSLKPGGVFYICSPSGALETVFRLAVADVGLQLRQQLVWVKDRFVLGRQDYHGRHETILNGWADGDEPQTPGLYDAAHETVLYGWADGAAHTWDGGRRQDTVWEHARPSASRLHPTMKPVSLVRRAIENSTTLGGRVLDLFGGSGSTAIAAYGSGRRSLTMEFDPRYVDVICRRWQEHTGELPVLEATGQSRSFVDDRG